MYTMTAADDALKDSNPKGMTSLKTYWDFNPLKAGHDMFEQMVGRSNVSWYKLGAEIMFIMLDSKNNESLYLHLPVKNTNAHNKISNPSLVNHGFNKQYRTTNQIYMWTVPIKTIKQWRYANSLRNSYL